LAALGLISLVRLASFVIMLPKYFKYSTYSSYFLSIIICNGKCFLDILSPLPVPHLFPFNSIFPFQLVNKSIAIRTSKEKVKQFALGNTQIILSCYSLRNKRQEQHSTERNLFTSKFDLNLRNIVVKC
jgi:hypothetical protein